MSTNSKRALDSSEESSEDEQESWEVERILAQEEVAGKLFYLVKWKDFPHVESTWEPEENFDTDITLKEWRIRLAAGDTLDAEEVRQLDERREVHQAKKEEQMAREKQERREERRKRRKLMEQVQSFDEEYLPSQPEISKRTTPTLTRSTLPSRTSSSRACHSLANSSHTHSDSNHDEQAQKFHGVEPARALQRPEIKDRGRQSTGDNRFRSLRHMNNAQKKAQREREPPATDPRLKSVADLTASDPAHILPARKDAPSLFSNDHSPNQQDQVAKLEAPPQARPVIAGRNSGPQSGIAETARIPTGPRSSSFSSNQQQLSIKYS